MLDFGIAKIAEYRGSIKTAAGSIFGTPAYMAPEQCSDAATVDHRADIYALGCIFYELLSGKPPFGSGGIELLAAHLRDDPPPLRQLEPTVPIALEAVVMRTLAKDPDARQQTCKDLIAALESADLTPPTPTLKPTLVQADAPISRSGTALAFAATMAPQRAGQPSRTGTLSGVTGAPGGEPAVARDTRPKTGQARRVTPLGVSQIDAAAFDTLYPVAPDADGAAGRAGERKPSDETGASDARDPAAGGDEVSRRRRRWPLVVLLVVLAGGGATAFVLARASRAPADRAAIAPDAASGAPDASAGGAVDVDAAEPPDPAQAQIDEARAALVGLDWDKAEAALARALEVNPDSKNAKALVEQIAFEKANAKTYAAFTKSYDRRDVAALATSYAALPDSSVYKERARPVYEATRDFWLAERRKDAGQYLKRTRCSPLAKLVGKVAEIFPEQASEFRDMLDACRKKQSSQDKGDKGDQDAGPGPGPKPDAGPALPAKLNKQAVLNALRAFRTRLGRCRAKRGNVKGKLELTIRPDGKLKEFLVKTNRRGYDRCVSNIIRQVEFPPARGTSSVKFKLPLRLRGR